MPGPFIGEEAMSSEKIELEKEAERQTKERVH